MIFNLLTVANDNILGHNDRTAVKIKLLKAFL